MNRFMVALVVLVLLLVVGLLGLGLYLTGGQDITDGGTGPAPEVGLVHVKTIYTAQGENLARPVGVGADENGGFFVTLRDSQRVIEFDANGDFVRKWGERGLEPGQLLVPLGVAVDRLSNHVYVVDRSRLRLIAYDTEGQYLWERPILNPTNVATIDGGVLVTTFGPLAQLDAEGQVVAEAGSRGPEVGQFDFARAADQLSDGRIVVADTNNTRVQCVNVSGEVTATVDWVQGQPPRHQDDTTTVFGVPSGIAVDDQDRIFVLDGFRHEISVLDPATGEIVYTFDELEGQADGLFYLPTGIAHLGGDRFAISDTFNDRVQIVRLLLPEDNTVLARNPWMRWLLLLLLVPLFFALGRKRVYVTRAAMDRAAEEGKLRLLAGAFRKLYVLPATYDAYKDVSEESVEIGEFLVRADAPDSEETPDVIASVAKPSVLSRLLIARHRVVARDAEELNELGGSGVKHVITFDEVDRMFALEGVEDESPKG